MRGDPAPAEARLWAKLRDKQLGGFKFRRQHAIEHYVLDFFCAECSLVIELDGDSHAERGDYDARRTARLNKLKLCVVRFSNADVFDHFDSVLEEILRAAESIRDGTVRPSP